ncbi:MAG: biotin--[acetyl-CoA-carboxylase] ligase [Anaerolineales bacterium]|nr:biotin--[acetyl-CoA-carboxylase] ligase [Anaerolineales bacterium]
MRFHPWVWTMDEKVIRSKLPIGDMGAELYFHEELGSTNVEANRLIDDGAPHGALVVTKSQTAGKGRLDRQWISISGASLTFSLVLQPDHTKTALWSRLNALGAIAIVDVLQRYGIKAQVKWPNDVLVNGDKVAGVLVEGKWSGSELKWVILGIGINVRPGSYPPNNLLDYPAISIEEALGQRIELDSLLLDILKSLSRWYNQVDADLFIETWQKNLAFLGKNVVVQKGDERIIGVVKGIRDDGVLCLQGNRGELIAIETLDSSLRPLEGEDLLDEERH